MIKPQNIDCWILCSRSSPRIVSWIGDIGEAHYTLDKRDGGEARRNVNNFALKPHKPPFTAQSIQTQPKWMRWVKGFFVYLNEGNMARDRHTEEEVIAASESLKKRHPYAQSNRDNTEYIELMFATSNSEK